MLELNKTMAKHDILTTKQANTTLKESLQSSALWDKVDNIMAKWMLLD